MLARLKKSSLWRFRYSVESRDNKHVVIAGKKLLNFSGNDYLSLSGHPDVTAAFSKAALKYGLGSTSSPLFSGYSSAHQELEEAFADFAGRERALLFNSGYHANLAVMTTFANRHTDIVADKLIHASSIDGITLSRAQLHRYQHQDIHQADTLLQQDQHHKKLLVTESIFSMEGDITDAKQLALSAKKHRAMFILDDAHGIGVLGKSGKGICEHADLSQDEAPCLITPLGKAPGSMGAIVSGSDDTIEMLIQSARSYRYSTALPPAVCAATIVSLKLLENETWRREKLNALIQFFNREAIKRELKLASTDITPIRCILVGDSQLALSISDQLREQGILVACARPPAVPEGTARLRISLNCAHDEADVVALLDAITSRMQTQPRANKFMPGWGFKESVWDHASRHPAYSGSPRPNASRPRDDKQPLIGWSFGGLLAINECAKHPERYSHLILISTTPRLMLDDNWIGMSETQINKQLANAKNDIQQYQQQFLRLACYPDKSQQLREHINTHMQPHDAPTLLPDLQTLFDMDARSAFAMIKIPVLQIIGEKDLVITPQQSLQSNKLVHFQHHIIHGAGHMLLYTHSMQVAQLIQEFIC